ncbi:MAG: ArsR family transcriptional regulator [Thaumarchaeota archaeon]|nr:ArsR family transcriptional regulator [Nitrososphaerota archaeon]
MPGIDDIVSSNSRMKIAGLISIRPRSLGELAEITGISVQGVLKHLVRLRKSGFLTESELREGKYLRYRKVYSIEGRRIVDFSQGDLMVAYISKQFNLQEGKVKASYEELETVAEDMIITRRRIRDAIKRLERLIEELSYGQERLMTITRTIGLDREEEQIARILFTEDGIDDTKKTLSRYYGLKDAEGSVRKVIEKIRGA